VVASWQFCSDGCSVQPSGTADLCQPAPAGAPTSVRAASGDSFAEVRWAVATDPAGDFVLRASPGGASQTAAPSDRRSHFAGLTNGTSYAFTVETPDGLRSLASNVVTPEAGSNVIGDVPHYMQERPLTCEEASLRMVLEHAGVVESESDILNEVGIDSRASSVDAQGVLHWGDPYTSFVGDPSGSEPKMTGYGTYYPTIARVATTFGATVVVSGENQDPSTIYAALLANHPVVAWIGYDWQYHPASMDWQAFDGRDLAWHGPYEHAIALVGVTPTVVLVSNPTHSEDWQYVTKAAFELGFSTYSNMAVIIQ
jgi:uncharacterized protein YvpB